MKLSGSIDWRNRLVGEVEVVVPLYRVFYKPSWHHPRHVALTPMISDNYITLESKDFSESMQSRELRPGLKFASD